jgi:DNA polymerase III subunit delta
MIAVLYGADELALKRRMGEIRAEADGGSGMLVSNTTVLTGNEATAEAILGPVMSVPFLAPFRLVVVEELFGRFERRGRGSEEQQEAREAKAGDAFAPLFKGLAGGIPPTTMLVFTGGKVAANNPLLKRLRELPGVAVEEFAQMKQDEVVRFIRQEAGVRGMRFRPGRSTRVLDHGEEWRRPKETDPADYLAKTYQSNTLAIANELDKLALYTMGREVTVDDVDLLCGGEREERIFAFVDAAMDGKVAEAMRVLDYLVNRANESYQGVLALLLTRYRQMVTVTELLTEGASAEEIGVAVNQKYPRLRDEMIRRARRLGQKGVRDAYEAIVGADRATKSGLMKDDVAMEVLLYRLAGLTN